MFVIKHWSIETNGLQANGQYRKNKLAIQMAWAFAILQVMGYILIIPNSSKCQGTIWWLQQKTTTKNDGVLVSWAAKPKITLNSENVSLNTSNLPRVANLFFRSESRSISSYLLQKLHHLATNPHRSDTSSKVSGWALNLCHLSFQKASICPAACANTAAGVARWDCTSGPPSNCARAWRRRHTTWNDAGDVPL